MPDTYSTGEVTNDDLGQLIQLRFNNIASGYGIDFTGGDEVDALAFAHRVVTCLNFCRNMGEEFMEGRTLQRHDAFTVD